MHSIKWNFSIVTYEYFIIWYVNAFFLIQIFQYFKGNHQLTLHKIILEESWKVQFDCSSRYLKEHSKGAEPNLSCLGSVPGLPDSWGNYTEDEISSRSRWHHLCMLFQCWSWNTTKND